MSSIAVFCPAKVNLMLAVTGKRGDGYHDLFSVVAPVQFGDLLWVHRREASKSVTLSCTDSQLDTGPNNLVLQAVEAFRERYPFSNGLDLELEKRIPAGAGLGGGSSDAVGTLRALNQLFGFPLGEAEMMDAALSIGSDCPFFLLRKPAVMEGRGESVRPLSDSVRQRLSGQPLLLFKPSFSIPTGAVYRQMAADGGAFYCSPGEAQARFQRWRGAGDSISSLLYNNMEAVVFRKYLPIPALKRELETAHPVRVLMSGSGSACFCPLDGGVRSEDLKAAIREAWGECAFLMETRLI
ncbi:MAG: 4-(cytidine 5'-diphospho)-2-C-methyl-D-erythritol kinase [Opitutales bacterium]